jgi:glutathione S-transferase
MAPHFILEELVSLEELSVKFDLVLVDRKSDEQKSTEYLKLNPAGRIPTLLSADLVLFESPAICIYLAEQHPEANLMPVIGTPERAKFYQWMMYLTNTVQAELMIYFYPEKHTQDQSSIEAIRTQQEIRVTEMFELLDKEIGCNEFLVGEHVTACDYFLLMLAIWADEFDKPPLAFDNLARYVKNLTKRKAVQKVCATEYINLDDYR